tara:strand:+ start:180 stop:665 length:486 start_codon:yes stop_codon:yes gene_type:complete
MEVNKLNTESVLKFLGVVFFIGMVWFFVFTVFKTNNQYLGILLKEQEDKLDYRREGFGTMEGYQNLKSKGVEMKQKINKLKDDKEINEKKAGISRDASDDLKDDVSEYIRYEIENLDALAVIELLNLEKTHSRDNSRFKAVEKILKRRDMVKQIEKSFNSK